MALGFEDGDVIPLHVTTLREEATHQVDLLYMTKGDKSHWYLITNLNRLLYRTKCKGRSHRFCRLCLIHQRQSLRKTLGILFYVRRSACQLSYQRERRHLVLSGLQQKTVCEICHLRRF